MDLGKGVELVEVVSIEASTIALKSPHHMRLPFLMRSTFLLTLLKKESYNGTRYIINITHQDDEPSIWIHLWSLIRYGVFNGYKHSRFLFFRVSWEDMGEIAVLESHRGRGFEMCLLDTMSAFRAFTSLHNIDHTVQFIIVCL